jgi:hypothetical protein
LFLVLSLQKGVGIGQEKESEMRTLILVLALLAFIKPSEGITPKEYRYEIRIAGDRFADPNRVYLTDSVFQIGKRSFWIGSDGVNYGILTKQLTITNETIY